MWDVFPIQCEGVSGRSLQTIDPTFAYKRDPEVQIKPWKEVPEAVRFWAQMIWKEEFDCERPPLGPRDLVAWIPGQATLLARKGYWVGDHQSKPMAFIDCNYVHSMLRGHRIAERLIQSLCHEVVAQWSISAFAFEIQDIPRSLRSRRAVPLSSFQYVWVPTLFPDTKWTRMPTRDVRAYLHGQKGFHTRSYPGVVGYEHADTGHRVILDCHNDVIAYDSFGDLASVPGDGRYVRVFGSGGQFHLFLENVYCSSTSKPLIV